MMLSHQVPTRRAARAPIVTPSTMAKSEGRACQQQVAGSRSHTREATLACCRWLKPRSRVSTPFRYSQSCT
jgi:hypothetical protein